jgi:hypothetical protein
MNPSPLLQLVVGAALLFLGRRLFWFFVGGVGFLVGAGLGAQWMTGASELAVLLFALAIGLIAAVVSIFLQRLMVAMAGFAAGGYLAHTTAVTLGQDPAAPGAFLVGGLLSALLVWLVFDWALVVLSVLIGSFVVIGHLPLGQPVASILLVAMIMSGIFVQSRSMKGRPAKNSSRTARGGESR